LPKAPEIPAVEEVEHKPVEQDSAKLKARQLLCQILPDEAREEFLTYDAFHWNGKNGTYRISRDAQTEIYRNGRLHAHACLQLTIPAPSYDRMIAEYLILNSNERLYWSKANIYPAKERNVEPLTIILILLNILLSLKLVYDYIL